MHAHKNSNDEHSILFIKIKAYKGCFLLMKLKAMMLAAYQIHDGSDHNTNHALFLIKRFQVFHIKKFLRSAQPKTSILQHLQC